MKCKLANSGPRDEAPRRWILVGVLLLVAFALFSRPTASGHEHDPTILAVYVEWRTNRVRLHYPVAANKTYVLQYLALANTNNRGASLLNAPWVNLPGQQALRLPAPFDWEMSDFSVTNRHPTNLGRIYRLKVT